MEDLFYFLIWWCLNVPPKWAFFSQKRDQPVCPLCNHPVSLEDSKTDEDGDATHEEFYVKKVCARQGIEPRKIANSK
jgi:hypothetical protein